MMKYLKTFENKEPEKEIEYYDNGDIQSITYKIRGKIHRENGPAYQAWNTKGVLIISTYYINDKRHRENGPAYESWYDNGEESYNVYYLNSIYYTRENWIEQLKKINSPHYQEQKELYEMEKDIEKYNL